MRKLTSFLFLVLLIISSSCNTTNNSEEYAETLAAKAKLVEADAKFSIDLFKAIHATDTSKNIFVSPLSVSMALGMTMNGATGNTRFEMQNSLGFPDMTKEEINKGYRSLIRQLENADKKVAFKLANSVWAREGYEMNQDFVQTVENYFDAETATLDFDDPRSLEIINKWVSDKTNEKIPTILEAINPEDLMFLINAVYFKGSWTSEFDPENTEPSTFYLSEIDEIQTSMMNQLQEANYLVSEQLTVLELPYGKEAFSAIFIKPTNREDSIDNIISNQLSSQALNSWMSELNKAEIIYSIPKLELEYKRQLKDDLRALGMSRVFSSNAELDSLFIDVNNLYVSSVLQKTF